MPRSLRLAHKRLLGKGKRKTDCTDNRLSYYDNCTVLLKISLIIKTQPVAHGFSAFTLI